MKNSNKKGFTIVELVIVIAVIAILAAVLIPTFSSLVSKANLSADEITVRNMNGVIARAIAKGEKVATVDEAIKVLKEDGFNIDAATQSGYYYMWYTKDSKVLLVNVTADKQEVTYPKEYAGKTAGELSLLALTSDGFKEINSADDISGEITNSYAKYLFNTDVKLSSDLTLNISNQLYLALDGKELDLGGNKLTIKSTSATAAVMIGNGTIKNGTVIIDAPNGNIYDSGVYLTDTTLDIKAVANSSYHFYGSHQGAVNINQGRFVIEEKAAVKELNIDAASPVTVDNMGSLIKIDVKDTENNKTAVISINNTGSINTVVDSTNGANSDNLTISGTQNVMAGNELEDGFYTGKGTKEWPYAIATAEEFANIATLSNAMRAGSARYFILADDIDLSEYKFEKSYVSFYFCGQIDGNNHSVISNDSLSSIFTQAAGNTTFANINFKLGSKIVKWCRYQTPGSDITFDNLDIFAKNPNTSYSLTANIGIYLDWVGKTAGAYFSNGQTGKFTFKNCDANINISDSDNYSAIFVGGGVYRSELILDSCTYSGTFYGTKISPFIGNALDYTKFGSKATINNCANNGTLYGTSYKPVFAGASSEKGASWVKCTGTNKEGNLFYISDTALKIEKDSDGQIIIHKGASDATQYVLQFTGGTRYHFVNGTNTGENSTYVFKINLGNITFDSNGQYKTGLYDGMYATKEQFIEIAGEAALKNAEWKTFEGEKEEDRYCLVKYNGTYYYVFDYSSKGLNLVDENGNEIETVYTWKFMTKNKDGSFKNYEPVDINSATVIDYNAQGIILGSKTIEIK